MVDNIKWTNICSIRVPEGEDGERADILFEEIMAEHFPKWGKKRYSDPGILESSK